MKRQPEQLSDATIQPIMFVLLFAYVFGGAIDVPGGGNYREFLMGGHLRPDHRVHRLRRRPVARQRPQEPGRRPLPVAADRQGRGARRPRRRQPAQVAAADRPDVDLRADRSAGGSAPASSTRSAATCCCIGFAFAMIWVGVLLGSLVATPEGVTGIAFAALFPITFMASTFVPTDDHARRPADDRRVEPGHDAVRRGPGAVRQPEHADARRATRGRSPTRWPTR